MINPRAELFRWGPIGGKPVYLDSFNQAISSFPDLYKTAGWPAKISWPDMIANYKDCKILYIIEQQGMMCGLPFFTDYLSDEKCAKEKYNEWRRAAKKIEEEADKVNRGLSGKPDSLLAKDFDRFYNLAIDLWHKEFVAELSNYSGGPYLREKVFNYFKDGAVSVFEKLTAPEYQSIFQKEELELLQIKLCKGAKEQNDRLQKHQQEYYWLHNSYSGTEILPLSYFKERLDKVTVSEAKAKIEKIISYPEKLRDEKKAIIEKYNVPAEIIAMAETLCFTTSWQDQQKKFTLLMDQIITVYLEELARRKKLSFSYLCFYTLSEIKELICLGKTADVAARKESCAVYYKENGGLSWILGDEAKALLGPFMDLDTTEKTAQLKGLLVSLGKGKNIRAKVKILRTPKEIGKLEKGEILVAPMTSPEYINAMRKASAIVTDVGGITSHAAIIARELNIPCIVNTKVATKILCDGDLVEIDIKLAIVKVLNT